MTKYWIYSKDPANAEYLRSVGVTLGPRKGDYWRDCDIPDEAEFDMNEHWGEITWGDENETRPPITFDRRVRVKCGDCGCSLKEDGTCTYPLCKPKALGRKARLRESR